MPVIAPDAKFLLLAALLCLVSIAIWVERTSWGRHFSAALTILVGGAILSNLGVIPQSAPMYSIMGEYFVPVAIPLFLMRADVRKSIREAGRTLVVFLAAATGTVVGVFVAFQIVDLGIDGASLAGILTASYIGGGVNFVAVAEALQLQDSSAYVAALSADTVCSVLYLAFLIAIPSAGILRRLYPFGAAVNHQDTTETGEKVAKNDDGFDLFGAANGLAISLTICAFGWWVADFTGLGYSAFIVTITLATLVIANFGKRIVSYVKSEFGIGMLLIYLFFGSLGASADLSLILGAALPLFVFLMIVLSVHVFVVLVAGRLGRFGLDEMVIASNACVLGPPTAAAMAAGFRWSHLVTPGMLVGVIGYSFATFVGLTVASIL